MLTFPQTPHREFFHIRHSPPSSVRISKQYRLQGFWSHFKDIPAVSLAKHAGVILSVGHPLFDWFKKFIA